MKTDSKCGSSSYPIKYDLCDMAVYNLFILSYLVDLFTTDDSQHRLIANVRLRGLNFSHQLQNDFYFGDAEISTLLCLTRAISVLMNRSACNVLSVIITTNL